MLLLRGEEAPMFVQVITGQVDDVAGMQRMLVRWEQELRPGATGYLGTTGGVAADGRSIALVRFDSEDAARANADRPEQGAWWAEMEKLYVEPPTFEQSTDVESKLGGGSDEAGFVQVMRGTADRARLAAMDDVFEQHAATMRPDVMGLLRVWTGPDRYVEAVYFTSESAAREGEQSQLPDEVQEQMAEFADLMDGVDYLDLTDPWFTSA
jgi:hypothetical protein